MKAYQIMLRAGDLGKDHNYHILYTRNRPKWNVVRRELARDIDSINQKMLRQIDRQDFQELGDRRKRLMWWLEMIPESGEVCQDDMVVCLIMHPSVTVREITIL